jgi:hypothetical protein
MCLDRNSEVIERDLEPMNAGVQLKLDRRRCRRTPGARTNDEATGGDAECNAA